MAGGMPLAFTQEDFLVISKYEFGIKTPATLRVVMAPWDPKPSSSPRHIKYLEVGLLTFT